MIDLSVNAFPPVSSARVTAFQLALAPGSASSAVNGRFGVFWEGRRVSESVAHITLRGFGMEGDDL